MNRNLIFAAALLLAILACNFIPPTPTANPPTAAAPAATQSDTAQPGLPQSEASVPRVTVADARAAVDSGQAVIVDVRSQGAYEANHVAGALYIPLGAIETDPVHLPLDPNQWIITYCT